MLKLQNSMNGLLDDLRMLVDDIQSTAPATLASRQIINGVELITTSTPQTTLSDVYAPMASIVLQGSMEVSIGQALLHYDPGTCFVGSIDLPITSRITTASAERPYRAIHVQLERDSLADLIAEALDHAPEQGKCYALGPASPELLEACYRLLQLPLRPEDVPVIGPMIRKEMLYRLLRGPQAGAIHQIVLSDPKIQQVRRALIWIRENLEKSVPIADMATCAGMSQSSFRRHFRVATGMSPLQYQKTLRLQAARRAILAGTDVSRAAFDVGYESPSQFSREYSRTFGVAPSRDPGFSKDAPCR